MARLWRSRQSMPHHYLEQPEMLLRNGSQGRMLEVVSDHERHSCRPRTRSNPP